MQQCYPAYTKGPCQNGEYLVLPRNGFIPECVPNPCQWENWVPFRNQCHKLDEGGPCTFPELPNVVGVNETTLEIICSQDYRIGIQTRERFGDDMLGGNKTTTPTTTTTTPTKPPPPEPFSNGTNFFRRECFVGGIRWTRVDCPDQKRIEQIFSIPRQ